MALLCRLLERNQHGKKKKKFGVKDQVYYLFGDVGGSFVNLYVDAYFLVFCTYVQGVSTYFMGTLFLIAISPMCQDLPISGNTRGCVLPTLHTECVTLAPRCHMVRWRR